MLGKIAISFLFTILILLCAKQRVFAQQHDILFCGETIPTSNNFVSDKLMDIIRRQIPNVNLPSLHNRAVQYFPYVASVLRLFGLPEDFKYLPIVESGFTLEISNVGARGFWQIMPDAATDMGLVMTPNYDERDDIQKSTNAACKVLVSYYNTLQRLNNVASWVLAAAAYNFGIGNISKAIKKQGKDYFTMNLNAETAAYVYKIIAVKELFEYPELYMKSFGYNVFSASASKNAAKQNNGKIDTSAFTTIEVKIPTKFITKKTKTVLVAAHITGKYKDFHDGDLVSLTLNEDLIVQGGYTKKNEVIKGAGWIIDNRVYIDLGYGHELGLMDASNIKGIALAQLKNNEPVLLKNEIFDENAQWK